MRRAFVLVTAVFGLTGCVIGPKYVRPTMETPPAYREAPQTPGVLWKASQPGDKASRGKWWEQFHDPALNDLEAQLEQSNPNIQAAASAVLAARALLRGARASFLPTVTADPAITNARLSTFGPKPAGVVYSQFALPVEASWEPDLWGRVKNTVAGTAAAAQASVADLENVRLAAEADLATDYFELRYQDELKRVLDATVAAYGEAVDLNRSLDQAGLGTDEAVAQAEVQWKAAVAADTNLGNLRAQYEHAIATLVGRPAPQFSLAATAVEPVAAIPVIPAGVPSELLERRPDIAAAERAMAQANAQIGVAKTAFYPTLTLAATGGFQNLALTDWITWPSRVWSVGPSLAQTIFDGGARKAVVEQARAGYDQTVATYRETVLTAFQQVEDNLAALGVLKSVIDEEGAAIAAARRSFGEADVRYRSGLDPYLNVLTAQTALLSVQQSQVNFELERTLAAVQLIKALGGGWEAGSLPEAKELAAH